MIEPKKAPDGMPQLSRGKHRSPKTGACFMEFASFLAGEPWSDSPQCTDPMLAHLAVNEGGAVAALLVQRRAR